MDFLNKAVEKAKVVSKIAADAAQKGVEQAQPLVREGVAKAQDLKKTIVEQTPHVAAAAHEQANAAMQYAKKAADATVGAVHSATARGAAPTETTPSPAYPPEPPKAP